MDQSPLHDRPKAPSEKPPSDNLPEKEIGKSQVRQQGPASRGPQVPDLNFSGGGYRGGNTDQYESRGSGAPADLSSGSPGYEHQKDIRGGTEHQFPEGSE